MTHPDDLGKRLTSDFDVEQFASHSLLSRDVYSFFIVAPAAYRGKSLTI